MEDQEKAAVGTSEGALLRRQTQVQRNAHALGHAKPWQGYMPYVEKAQEPGRAHANASALLQAIAALAGGVQHGSAQVAAAQLLAVGVGRGAEDATPVLIRDAAKLVLKAVAVEGLVNGAQFTAPSNVDRTVDEAYFIAHGDTGDNFWVPGAIRPLFGMCYQNGEYVFVIYPRAYTLNELCEHVGLSKEDVQRLAYAADRIKREANRTLWRRGAQMPQAPGQTTEQTI